MSAGESARSHSEQATATSAAESTLFLRKATGLVRSWSVFDAFIYAFFSINLVTLGFYIISQMWFFEGGLIPALIISGIIILAACGWRLRVAEPHPRRRGWLCTSDHWMVVHPLALDTNIRRHAAPNLFRPA